MNPFLTIKSTLTFLNFAHIKKVEIKNHRADLADWSDEYGREHTNYFAVEEKEGIYEYRFCYRQLTQYYQSEQMDHAILAIEMMDGMVHYALASDVIGLTMLGVQIDEPDEEDGVTAEISFYK